MYSDAPRHRAETNRFAGGMIAAGDLLLDRIRHYFGRLVWSIEQEHLEICFAGLGQDAGITGSAALALHAKEVG